MTNTILHAIFTGELLPWEGKPIKTPRYKEMQRKISVERDHFEEEMLTHEKGRFDQYHCLLQERNDEEMGTDEYKMFMLGIAVGIEIIEHKQGLLNE